MLIDTKEEINKLMAGYKDLIEWKCDTRYAVSRKYLDEPKLFVDVMLHEITNKVSPWKPLQYACEELTKDVERLKLEKLATYQRKGEIHSTAPNSRGMPGRCLMTHFNKHFWDVRPKGCQSLPEAFHDKRIIYRCLNISYKENESLSMERLLREINFHYSKFGRTSHFAPGFARTIIRLMDMSGARIFDPCCGWGGRLLGAWLEGCTYVGCDISPNTYRGLVGISDFINYDCNIVNKSCTDVDWPVCDLILTSPPFYDIEEYVGGDQPWRYQSRAEWIDKFIKPFVEKIHYKCALYLDFKTKDDFEQIKKFDKIIDIKNRRHARRKMGEELLCVYD